MAFVYSGLTSYPMERISLLVAAIIFTGTLYVYLFISAGVTLNEYSNVSFVKYIPGLSVSNTKYSSSQEVNNDVASNISGATKAYLQIFIIFIMYCEFNISYGSLFQYQEWAQRISLCQAQKQFRRYEIVLGGSNASY